MILLTGDSFSRLGSINGDSFDPINTISKANHVVDISNKDGYILNGKQYFWDPNDFKGHYSKSDVSDNNIFPLFPTKVLLGTGKEYSSWEELQNDTQVNYPDKYNTFKYVW